MIAYFVQTHFNKLSNEDKILVKNLNRLCPSLNSLVNSGKGSNRKLYLDWYRE